MADAARCLLTRANNLSVFKLDEPDSQTERVVAALALTRDSLANMDLALVPEGVLEGCGIERVVSPADTPDSEVNKWHVDLVELTLAKIALLASAIRSEGRVERYNELRVRAAIENSVGSGFVAGDRVNAKLVNSLDRRGIRVGR